MPFLTFPLGVPRAGGARGQEPWGRMAVVRPGPWHRSPPSAKLARSAPGCPEEVPRGASPAAPRAMTPGALLCLLCSPQAGRCGPGQRAIREHKCPSRRA